MSVLPTPAGGNAVETSRFKYPNPFFDIASTYVPPSMKTLFRYTKYFYYSNSIISPIIYKLSEYPITSLVYEKGRGEESLSEKTKETWVKMLEENLKIRRFQIEINLDYNVYGNCFVSIFYPFIRLLVCPACKKKTNIKKVKWSFKRWKFRGTCPACEAEDQEFKVEDKTIKNRKQIKLVRWNPMNVSIDHNTITGKSVYVYQMPNREKQNIMLGKPGYIDTIPWVFVEAAKENKNVELEEDNLFHFKRASISDSDMGWGMPIILPVIKIAYYLQVLRKAQECVSLSTLIETNKGLVKADDVRVGDVVRTHLGRWREVESKWYRDARDGEVGIEITPTSMRPFSSVYSPTHPMIIIMRNNVNRRSDTKERQRSSKILSHPHLYEEGACPARDIRVGDYLLYPKSLPTDIAHVDVAAVTGMTSTDKYVYSSCSIDTALAFEALERGEHVKHNNAGRAAKRCMREGTTPMRMPAKIKLDDDLAYILGWYAGDGSSNNRTITITLGLNNKKGRLISAFENVFGKTCSVIPSKISKCLNVLFSDVMVTKLIKGLVPGTAKVKRVPIEIINASDRIKSVFLDGYCAADGYVDKDRIMYATSSKDLAYDTYRMSIHLGCIASIQEHYAPDTTLSSGHVIKGGWAYQVVISHRSKKRICAIWNGDKNIPVVESGKSGFFWKDYFATRVNSIDRNKEEDCYIDFKIKQDTTFCTPGSAVKNSIALEHVVPLRILFPQQNADSTPYVSMNLGSWKKKVENEIKMWRQDPNRISVMPVPVGIENLGGDAKALMITQEIKQTEQEIAGGLGVPIELLFGNLSYSGASISLRILENHFLTIIEFQNEFFRWVTQRLSRFFRLPPVTVKQSSFKMADDIQYKQFMLQMRQAGDVSSTTLLNENDLEFMKEQELIKGEQQAKNSILGTTQIQNAEIQGQLGVIQAKYSAIAQMESQKLMQSFQKQMMEENPELAAQQAAEGGAPGAGAPGAEAAPGQAAGPSGGAPGTEEDATMQQDNQMTIPQMVEHYATQIGSMPPEQQELFLQRMEADKSGSMPQLVQAIRQRLKELQSQVAGKGDMKPLPEQKPPRRKSSPV